MKTQRNKERERERERERARERESFYDLCQYVWVTTMPLSNVT